MEFLHHLVLLLHFVGFASLFGGALVQVRSDHPAVTSPMRDGAWTQLVTGVLLVGFLELGSEPVNHVKVGIKLALLLTILVLVLANRRATSITRGVLFTILGLTLATAAVAVFV